MAAKLWAGLRCADVWLSPKFHSQEDATPPPEVSLNCTGAPAWGVAGVNENDGSGAAGSTVTLRCATLVPLAFVTLSRTTYVPTRSNMWVGLRCATNGAPSPKSHDHDVAAPPLDSSVNTTAVLVVTELGAKENAATGAGSWATTVICCVETSAPAEFSARRVGAKLPGRR